MDGALSWRLALGACHWRRDQRRCHLSKFQHGKLNFRDTREVSTIYSIEVSVASRQCHVDRDPKGGVV